MALLDKVFKKSEEEIDVEEFLNNLDVEEEAMLEEADAYIKPITLQDISEITVIENELKEGNFVLLGIEELAKRNALRLKEAVESLKDVVSAIDGDIARISHDKIIVTPSRVKIVKRR